MITVFEYVGSLGDGGAETLVKDYALLLDKKLFQVKVLTIFPAKGITSNERILMENHIPIISLYKHNNLFIKVLRKLLKNVIDSWMLKILITRHSPSVIHVHMANLYALKPISSFLKSRDVKLFYTCHSLPEKFLGTGKEKEKASVKTLIQNNSMQLIALHKDMKMLTLF